MTNLHYFIELFYLPYTFVVNHSTSTKTKIIIGYYQYQSHSIVYLWITSSQTIVTLIPALVLATQQIINHVLL